MFGLADKALACIAGAVAIVLAVALLVTYLVDRARISDLTAQRDKAQTALVTEQGNSAKLGAGIEACNAGVTSLKHESDIATEAADAALAAAKTATEGFRTTAAQILAAKAGPDACKSTDDILKGHMP